MTRAPVAIATSDYLMQDLDWKLTKMDSMLVSSSSGQGYSYGTDGTGDANAALAELDQGLR